MRAPTDSTLILNQNHDFPLHAELSGLVINIQKMETEYSSAIESFRPFLSGASLYAIQKSLENKEIFEQNTPQTLLIYLKEIINLHQHMKQFLSEIHQLAVNNLIESEFKLLFLIIIKLEHNKQPLTDSLLCLREINQLLNKMISNNPFKSNVSHIKEAIEELQKNLNKQNLQQKINDVALVFSNFDSNSCTNIDESVALIALHRIHCEELAEQADKGGHNELVESIANILNHSYKIETQFIKRRLDNHLSQIEQNRWATIEIKKNMYQELLDIYNAVLNVSSTLTFTALEKEAYINHLHTGFELCLDERFLDLMNKSAHLFYAETSDQLARVLQYTEQSHNKFNLAHPILKKRHVRFEDVHPTVSAKRAKTNESESVESDSEDTTLLNSFINIIAPLNRGEHLSRAFLTVMLKTLGHCVWAINGVERSLKFTLNYDLLRQAIAVCPPTDSRLKKKLEDQIVLLSKGNERLVNDYNRFSNQCPILAPDAQMSQDDFKKILSEFTTQLKIYIPKESFNRQLEAILDEWKRFLINEHCIDIIHIDCMMDTIQGRESVSSTHLQASSSQVRRKPKGITDALSHASTDEFSTYLADLKLKMEDNYLTYLTRPGKNGNTPLHTSLSMSAAHNMEAYLLEIKKEYGASNVRSFHVFLTSQNKSGFTFLHQLAIMGQLDVLKNYTQFLKRELGEDGYAHALKITTKRNYNPCCSSATQEGRDINNFLRQEESQYLVQRSSSSRDRLFDKSNRASSSTSTPSGQDYRPH